MLMAQSFFWLSPSSVITTSIGSGLMITSQIEREKTVGGSVLNSPLAIIRSLSCYYATRIRHLWANQWKAVLRGCKIMAGAIVMFDLRLQANGNTPWPLQANEIWFLSDRRRAEHKASRNWKGVLKKIQHGESAGTPIGSLCEFMFKFKLMKSETIAQRR